MFTPSVHEERRNEGVGVNGLRYLRGGGPIAVWTSHEATILSV